MTAEGAAAAQASRHAWSPVAQADVQTVYAGIKKLVVVDVCLTRGQDDPQMIFESLNSTGVDLTQADLIRNFVLMRLDETSQTQLYEEYGSPSSWHSVGATVPSSISS